jgi:hypothetical protein
VAASQLLHLVVVAVFEGNVALSNLEEVAVWLIWGKVNIEDKGGIGPDLLLRWQHFEWILHKLSSSLV